MTEDEKDYDRPYDEQVQTIPDSADEGSSDEVTWMYPLNYECTVTAL